MNGAHLHLLVNHLPIIGFGFGLILLVVTMLRRGDRGMFLASVLILVIAGGGALAAQFSGEPAEEIVEQMPDISHNMIETHEGSAKFATISAVVSALLALTFSVIGLRREGPIAPTLLSILLIAILVTCGMMTWTGMTGGKIHHSEVHGTALTVSEYED